MLVGWSDLRNAHSLAGGRTAFGAALGGGAEVVAAGGTEAVALSAAAKAAGAKAEGGPGEGGGGGDGREAPEGGDADGVQGGAALVCGLVPGEAEALPTGVLVAILAAKEDQPVEWRAGDVAVIPGRVELMSVRGPIGAEQLDHDVTLGGGNGSPAAVVSPLEALGHPMAPCPQDASRRAEEEREG